MIEGYICLGGGQEELFSQFSQHQGDPVGPHRGRWGLNADLKEKLLSIPSRDKQVHLLYNNSLARFSAGLAYIDSQDSQVPYRLKLKALLADLDPDFVGVVNNKATSSHKSLALLTGSNELFLHGLYDTRLKSAYLVWSYDPIVVQSILDAHPMRFLLYRFPAMKSNVLFLPIESTCSRWYQWVKNGDLLRAFNALELRLSGGELREA